jgi:hypothetical protein
MADAHTVRGPPAGSVADTWSRRATSSEVVEAKVRSLISARSSSAVGSSGGASASSRRTSSSRPSDSAVTIRSTQTIAPLPPLGLRVLLVRGAGQGSEGL